MAVLVKFRNALNLLHFGVRQLAVFIQSGEKIRRGLPLRITVRAHLQRDVQFLAVVNINRARPIIKTFARQTDFVQAGMAFEIAGRGTERHAVEFRHPSWFEPELVKRIGRQGLAVVVGDDPRRPLPVVEPVGGLAYLRLHRGRRGRRGRYSLRELDDWSEVLAHWRGAVEDVFVYLNNDCESFAVQNARELAARMTEEPRRAGKPRRG